jgi:Uncharacterised protein family (UPF0093)
MLWIKAFHIVFVTSWFAGLFYLPRIFVNLAMVPADSRAERERLLLMAKKLYRFITPLGVLAIGLRRPRWWSASPVTTFGAAACSPNSPPAARRNRTSGSVSSTKYRCWP